MRACKCPNCGANLNFDEAPNNYVYCQYCGTKIDLLDQRTMHTEHIIDDAKLKDAEAKMKNAENFSRIVNIFAAPVEEKQRQKEFERQQQAEAQRQAYEKEKQKEQERRENQEALENGCAAAMGGCLVQCVKHPLIACIILFLILVSCMGSSSSTSSIASTSASFSSSYAVAKKYDYSDAYTRISADDSAVRYYYLISYHDNVVTFVSSETNTAIVASIISGDLYSGLKIRLYFPTSGAENDVINRTLKYADPSKTVEILSIEDSGESFSFVKASLSAAEDALYRSDFLDYSS